MGNLIEKVFGVGLEGFWYRYVFICVLRNLNSMLDGFDQTLKFFFFFETKFVGQYPTYDPTFNINLLGTTFLGQKLNKNSIFIHKLTWDLVLRSETYLSLNFRVIIVFGIQFFHKLSWDSILGSETFWCLIWQNYSKTSLCSETYF